MASNEVNNSAADDGISKYGGTLQLVSAVIYLLIILFLLVPTYKYFNRYVFASHYGDTPYALMYNYYNEDILDNGAYGNPVTYLVNYRFGYNFYIENMVSPGSSFIAYFVNKIFNNHFSTFNAMVMASMFLLSILAYRFTFVFFKNPYIAFFSGLLSLFSFPMLEAIWIGLPNIQLLFILILLLIYYLNSSLNNYYKAFFLGLFTGLFFIYNATLLYFFGLYLLFDFVYLCITNKYREAFKFYTVVFIGLLIFTLPRAYLQTKFSSIIMDPEESSSSILYKKRDMDYLKSLNDLVQVNSAFGYDRALDLYSLFLPPGYKFDKTNNENHFNPLAGTCYFGIHIIFLGLYGLYKTTYRHKKRLIFTLSCLFVISLGPYLVFKQSVLCIPFTSIPIPLPDLLLVKFIPLLKQIQHIGRIAYIIYYIFVIFSLYGVWTLVDKFHGSKFIKIAGLLGFALLHIATIKMNYGFFFPFQINALEYDAALDNISKTPGDIRVGYFPYLTDMKDLTQHFPNINKMNYFIFTSLCHKKQSILFNRHNSIITNMMCKSSMSGADLSYIRSAFDYYKIKYLIYFNLDKLKAEDAAIKKNLDGLFKKEYSGYEYCIYSVLSH